MSGADFPPPVGFLWIILLDLIAALLVYRRALKRKRQMLQIMLEGWLVGLLFALLVLIFPGGGEPSVTPGLIDYTIWFIVLGCVGMINNLALYALIVILHRSVR